MEQDQQVRVRGQAGKEVIVKEQHLQHTQEMVEEKVWVDKTEEEESKDGVNQC